MSWEGEGKKGLYLGGGVGKSGRERGRRGCTWEGRGGEGAVLGRGVGKKGRCLGGREGGRRGLPNIRSLEKQPSLP